MATPHTQNTPDYLYTLANKGDYKTIIKHLRSHDDQYVRYGAAGILSESIHSFKRQTDRETRRYLIDAVLNEPIDSVRAHILNVLIELDESVLETIITRLESNPQNTPTDTPYPLILTKWYGSNEAELRMLAVVGFGRTGSHTAQTKLRTVIKKESNMRVLRRAIEEAGKIGDETFVTPLQNHLRADDVEFQQSSNKELIREIKHASVQSLVEIGTDAAYEALVTASRSADEELKEHVIGEIGRFGAESTVDLIVDELNNEENETLREEAASGIITTFYESEFDEGDSIRQQAIEIIAEDVSTDVSDEFVTIAEESPRPSERRNAVWLLGQLGYCNENTIDCLLSSLNSDDEYLQKVASASLSQFNRSEIKADIDEFLQKTDEDTTAHELASAVKSTLNNTAKQAKKDMVEYTKVKSPEDYTTSRPD